MVKPIIFQVVGYQNSGKTTIITKLINRLKMAGLNTVTIKHHGHGGKPEVNSQKDSAKHMENGAFASIIEGDGRLLLQVEKPSWSLQEKIQIVTSFSPDIILIEGHKQESYPKLALIKEKADINTIVKLSNIEFFMVWNPDDLKLLPPAQKSTSFLISDEFGLEQIIDYLKNNHTSN